MRVRHIIATAGLVLSLAVPYHGDAQSQPGQTFCVSLAKLARKVAEDRDKGIPASSAMQTVVDTAKEQAAEGQPLGVQMLPQTLELIQAIYANSQHTPDMVGKAAGVYCLTKLAR